MPPLLLLLLLLLLLFSAAASSPPATVPATPDQSVATIPCPLELPSGLLPFLSAACSTLSHYLCCPAVAAWLYSARSAALLAARPASLPLPPDDSELCAAAAEDALAARGVTLPRPSDVCDVAYCYCGVRLRPMTCPGPFHVASDEWRWVVAAEETGKRLERECVEAGVGGCDRCLRALYQLRSESVGGGNFTGAHLSKAWVRPDRECQLMGLTWLLAQDRARYLPTAALVIRALMLSPDADPTTCAANGDDDGGLPLPLLYGQMGPSSAVRWSLPLSLLLTPLVVFAFARF
ncbi:uncharacterized GPI-anchored protein At4g28100-like [Typha latifolia]|uniref:uncharacterized GPI-anchored protein At4g28100-like n=1 Tax=Typha latifolia TaxID=4733 RepID=UPI003C3052AE